MAELEWEPGIKLRCYGDQCFDPRCPNCCRFIKFPDTLLLREEGPGGTKTTCECSRCGPVIPLFHTWAD